MANEWHEFGIRANTVSPGGVMTTRVIARKQAANVVGGMPDEDFTSSLIKGFATSCEDIDALRMWLWEALDRSNRKLVAEEERRAYFQAEVARWPLTYGHGLVNAMQQNDERIVGAMFVIGHHPHRG